MWKIWTNNEPKKRFGRIGGGKEGTKGGVEVGGGFLVLGMEYGTPRSTKS